jgi:hypothetical protein
MRGCLSAFCDDVLRKEAIWSSEQLLQMLGAWVKSGQKAIMPENLADPEVFLFCREYLSGRLSEHERHPVPLVIQDIQSYQGNRKVSDIRYGWDVSGGYGKRIAKSRLPPISSAFTVSHANQYIRMSGPFQRLMDLLESVSTSYLEKLFYREWYNRYYAEDSPALIPEVHRFSTAKDGCGQRAFTYFDDFGRPHRGRIDFFVYNAGAGVAAFIEIDGHASHKTVEQRQIDAMKRNVCAEAGVPLHVFTYRDIEASLDAVMERLDYLFRASI